ncbi:hypothetical protein SFUMM280S_08154 [Streptomyces fumanus]
MSWVSYGSDASYGSWASYRLLALVRLLGRDRRAGLLGGEAGEARQVVGVLECWTVLVSSARAPRSSLAIRPCSFSRPRPTASRVLARTASKAPSLAST